MRIFLCEEIMISVTCLLQVTFQSTIILLLNLSAKRVYLLLMFTLYAVILQLATLLRAHSAIDAFFQLC